MSHLLPFRDIPNNPSDRSQEGKGQGRRRSLDEWVRILLFGYFGVHTSYMIGWWALWVGVGVWWIRYLWLNQLVWKLLLRLFMMSDVRNEGESYDWVRSVSVLIAPKVWKECKYGAVVNLGSQAGSRALTTILSITQKHLNFVPRSKIHRPPELVTPQPSWPLEVILVASCIFPSGSQPVKPPLLPQQLQPSQFNSSSKRMIHCQVGSVSHWLYRSVAVIDLLDLKSIEFLVGGFQCQRMLITLRPLALPTRTGVFFLDLTIQMLVCPESRPSSFIWKFH